MYSSYNGQGKIYNMSGMCLKLSREKYCYNEKFNVHSFDKDMQLTRKQENFETDYITLTLLQSFVLDQMLHFKLERVISFRLISLWM